ncbi:MAG: hypothetical protein OSJ73_23340 [Lachnospiraceae bacterium]|nr:hypothetical protein [Lachnospiraceae bacterium]
MAVSKDTEKGTWTSQIWGEDFQGKKSLKKVWVCEYKGSLGMGVKYTVSIKTYMNIKLDDFVEVYFRDKDGELKQRMIRNKRYMIEHHSISLLDNKAMDDITPVDIIQ